MSKWIERIRNYDFEAVRQLVAATDDPDEFDLFFKWFWSEIVDVEHFAAAEFTRLRHWDRHEAPSPVWWENIPPVVWLAEELRERLNHPLVVLNGYRPTAYNAEVGGAKNSQHLYCRAMDLGLPRELAKGEVHQETLYREAITLFCELGAEFKIGLGLYHSRRGTRIHIDVGHKCRFWERGHVKKLAQRLDLTLPR